MRNAIVRGLSGDESLLHAAGRPAPGVELRLADDGEILVRADQVMMGYWNDADATTAALVDGWLATGDIGRIDAQRYLSVVDRSKDIIITGGENVSSREVEDVLIAVPGVDRVAVVGAPDPHWGRWCAHSSSLPKSVGSTRVPCFAMHGTISPDSRSRSGWFSSMNSPSTPLARS